MKNISLYIHIPFCKSKCNYCDFNSFTNMEYLAAKYLEALKSELKYRNNLLEGYKIKTIFIGGGTPSLLSNSFYFDLFAWIYKNMKVNEDLEFTIEVNPGTIDLEKVTFYKNSGINRISIGLQAWQDNLLNYLGRSHNIKKFLNSINLIQKSGIINVNVDVIFAIPGQTMRQWEETIINILKLDINHISMYGLKIEEGTYFGKKLDQGEIKAVTDEIDREMYNLADNLLAKSGVYQYEISNFAKKNRECQHNLNYWECGEYIGIGAGAHSYFQNTRYNNASDINEYINRIEGNNIAVIEESYIDRDEQIKEYILLGLRCNKGIDLNILKDKIDGKERYIQIQGFLDKMKLLNERGLIDIQANNYKLTKKGFDLANQVFIEFI